MNSRVKLIIFFAGIAILVFVLGIIWSRSGGGNIQASSEDIDVVQGSEIKLVLDDYLESVTPGSKSIYNLVVMNNSKNDIQNLRIYGFVGLPTQGEPNIVEQYLPSWLVPGSMKNYPDNHYFNYVVDLKAKSRVEAKIVIKNKKYLEDQERIYSKAHLQVLTDATSKWNIFSLGGGYSGPIIASTEDINTIQ